MAAEQQKSGIEVQIIDWGDGRPRQVAVNFLDFNQMLMLDPENARNFAFLLMECADQLEPPFSEIGMIDPNDTSESEEIFGPYNADQPADEDDD